MKRAILYLSISSLAAVLVGLSVRSGRSEIIDASTPVPAVGVEGGPSRVLDAAELVRWINGRRLFDRDFHKDEGLGTPELNGDSCRSCHQKPAIGGAGGLDLNVFRFANDNGGLGPFVNLPGGQVASKIRRPDLPDRDEYDAATADVFEQRQTPSVFGGGLIDAIPDGEILLNEDPMDSNGDGVFGVARMLAVGGAMEVGRFGWKSQVPRMMDFVRDAMGGEIGLTVPDNGRGFGMLADADNVPDPEISNADLDDITFFLNNLAAPPRGGSTAPEVQEGEMLFAQVGCTKCHVPTLMSSLGPVALYSDLLLHDILPADFRGMSDPGAETGLYRTPPLWGASKTAPYFHDGRAETIPDAIAQHTSEATLVREAYDTLPGAQKLAILAFLNDL